MTKTKKKLETDFVPNEKAAHKSPFKRVVDFFFGGKNSNALSRPLAKWGWLFI